MEEQGTWKQREAGYGRPVDRGVWTAKTVKRPPQQPAHPQHANYWAPLTRKRHTMPHSAQPQHTNHWAPRMRKRHQQEHRPQRPTESSNPTQHAKGRTGDCPGSRKGATTRRNVTQGAGNGAQPPPPHPTPRGAAGALCTPIPPSFQYVPLSSKRGARETSPSIFQIFLEGTCQHHRHSWLKLRKTKCSAMQQSVIQLRWGRRGAQRETVGQKPFVGPSSFGPGSFLFFLALAVRKWFATVHCWDFYHTLAQYLLRH